MKKTFLLKTMLLLFALIVGSTSAWAVEGDELAICQGTGSGYGTRRTLTDSHSVSWVLSTGQTGYLGTNKADNHNKVKPTAADLPVVKAVKSDATTNTTGYYFYYTTTAVANVGSIEFSYTANDGNSSAKAYVVVGDAVSAADGDAYEIIQLASASPTAQNASLGTSGTFTYTFNQTQTTARYYGFIIVTSSYKRLTAGTIKLKEGAADPNKVITPTIKIPTGPFVSTKTVTIATETEGATIYYTTNGDEPTSSSTEYTVPFDISATTTIKAIAVKSQMANSNVAEATFTKETVLEGIAALKGATTTGSETTSYVNLTNAQVTYVYEATSYIEDAEYGFYIYGPSLTKNKVYNGIFEIKSKLYYSNPQITAIENVEGTITDGSDKAPTDITVSDLENNFNNNLGRQLKISGALVTSSGNDKKISSINLAALEGFSLTSITAGKGYDLIGYPSVYNSGKRFNVVSAVQVPIDPTIDVEDQSIAFGETFTVDESKINGGDITITSSNTAVATVSDLVITAVAVGTTTITVSTAASDDFNAGSETFTLTVTAPVGSDTEPSGDSVLEFDFTTNTWELPTTATATDANMTYTSGGYTFGISGSHKFEDTNKYLMLYCPCSLTFPSFEKKVTKIEIVGRGQASSGTKERIYVGNTAVSSECTGSTGTNTFVIDENYQEIGTIYRLDVSEKNAQITTIKVHTYQPVEGPKVTLSDTGYASYCSEYPLDFSTSNSDWAAYYVSGVNGSKVTFTKIDGKIKGGQGIILYGTPGTECQLTYCDSENELSGNMLVGTLAPTYVSGDNIYGLSGGKFKKINPGTIKANKAYLSTAAGAPALDIEFGDETTTGIQNIERTINDNQYYTLDGRRVAEPTKGIYIFNGKKVVIK